MSASENEITSAPEVRKYLFYAEDEFQKPALEIFFDSKQVQIWDKLLALESKFAFVDEFTMCV